MLFELIANSVPAADLFSEERRNKTLGLLFSTGISPIEVLVGKLSAVLIESLSRLFTIIPCLLIITLMRAITPQICFATIITLLALLALIVSVYLLSSLAFNEHTSGTMAAFGFLALVVGFFPLLDFLNRYLGSGRIDPFWMALNPGAAPWLIYDHPLNNAQLGYIYLSIAVSVLLALACFLMSTFLLSRIWKDQVSGVCSMPFATLLRSLRTRQRLTHRLLDSNPYEWLIHRDFQPHLIAWGTFATVALIWLLGFWHWEGIWLIPMNYWITLILIGLLVRWMTSYLSVRQIGYDRSNGTLELLLTSPLSVGDIVAAQHAAIQKFVRPLYLALGFLHLLFFILGLLFHPMNEAERMNYILISALVALFGPWFNFQGYWGPFWVGLNTGRPIFALTNYLFSGFNRFSFIWIFFMAFRVINFPNAPTGSLGETILIGCIVGGLILWYIFYRFLWTTDWNRSQQIRSLAILHMRAIAAEPVPEINDPRLNGWDHTKPLFDNQKEEEDENVIEAQDERRRQRILQQRSSS